MVPSGSATVLVIERNETTAHLLRRLLVYSGFDVIVAHSRDEALEAASIYAVDVVLLDADVPGVDGSLARALRATQSASLPILVLTAEHEHAGRARFLDAGFDACLSRPFSAGELLDRIQELLARRREDDERDAVSEERTVPARPGDGIVLAGFGTKGGVGKTMITTNLALAISKHHTRRTVLFDADFFFGDAHIHLSLPTTHTIADLLPQIDTLDEYAERALAKHPSGLYALLGPQQLEDAARIEARHVGRILAWLRRRFDVVVVDCPPAYDARVVTVLEQAEVVLLVVTPDIGSLKNVGQFLDLAATSGIPDDYISVVLNRADSKVGIEARMIERAIRHSIDFRIASGGRPIVLSVNRGTPIVLDAPRYPVARQIREMARVLVEQEFRETA